MQILSGTKREITLMQWNEVLAKAEKSLADSEECYRLYGDEDSKQWIPAEEGGDLYLINGNMTKLKDAGLFAGTGGNGKEDGNSDEEVLELEKQEDQGSVRGRNI